MRLAAPKKNWTPADYGKSWAWNENGWYEGSAMTQEEKAKVQEQLEIIKERNLNIDYNVWFIEIDGQLAGVYGRQLAGPDETELTETTKIPHHEKW